jgi:hypothetical protein
LALKQPKSDNPMSVADPSLKARLTARASG